MVAWSVAKFSRCPTKNSANGWPLLVGVCGVFFLLLGEDDVPGKRKILRPHVVFGDRRMVFMIIVRIFFLMNIFRNNRYRKGVMPETLNVICLLNWELVRAPLNNFWYLQVCLDVSIQLRIHVYKTDTCLNDWLVVKICLMLYWSIRVVGIPFINDSFNSIPPTQIPH